MNLASRRVGQLIVLFSLAWFDIAAGYPCRDPGSLLNARRLFQRGNRLVQFICDSGYVALGTPLLSCIRGRWRGTKPICVAPGCPPVEELRNGIKIAEKRGAVLTHTCNRGYELLGSSVLYCDGNRWNATRPVCLPIDGKAGKTQSIQLNANGPAQSEGNVASQSGSFLPIQKVSEIPLPNGVNNPLQNGANMPLQTGANSPLQNRPSIPLQNGQHMPLHNGARMPLENGPVPNMQNGQHMPLPNGAHMPLENGPVPNMQNGQHMPLPNGAHMPLENGPVVNMQNGQHMPLQNGQHMSLPNGAHMPSENGPIDNMQSGQHMPLLTGQNSYGQEIISNQQPIVQGQILARLPLLQQDKTTVNKTSFLPTSGISRPTPYQPEINARGQNHGQMMHNERNKQRTPHQNAREMYQTRPSYDYMPFYNPYNPYSIGYSPYQQRNINGRFTNEQAQIPMEDKPNGHQSIYQGNNRYGLSDNRMYNPRYGGYRPYRYRQDIRQRQNQIPTTIPQILPNSSFPLRRVPSNTQTIRRHNYTVQGRNSFNRTSRNFLLNHLRQAASAHSTMPTRVQRQNLVNSQQERGGRTHVIERNSQPTLVQQRHLTCPRPVRIRGGYHTTHPLPPDSDDDKYVYYIQYHCLSGLVLVGGDNTSYCQSNGQWSGTAPTCEVVQDCEQGFVQGKNGICTDINECNYNNGGCPQLCNNYVGGFYCTCQLGYQLQHDQSCMDINECDAYEQVCMHDCVNTEGSYQCACRSGFTLQQPSNVTCLDINECRTGQHNCMDTCVNTVGSYQCSCYTGRQLISDGVTCEDIYNNVVSEILTPDFEECEENWYREAGTGTCLPCPTNSVILENSEATTITDCVCQPGYHGNPELSIPCTDFNECTDGNYGCSHHCVNTDGGAHCDCPSGYALDTDGRQCTDINECSEEDVCDHGKCSNTRGSFQCVCYHGYRSGSDRQTCTDVNECEVRNGGCSEVCKNSRGGFRCACRGNARLLSNGKTCQAVGHACPPLSDPEHGHVLPARLCLGDYPITIGRVCIYTCSHGYQVQGESRRECGVNGWSGEPPTCLVTEFCPPLVRPNHTEIIPKSCYQQPNLQYQLCMFICRSGFVLVGNLTTRCGPNQQWDSRPSRCVRKYPTAPTVPPLVPMIQCPPDIDVALMDGHSYANVTVLGPVSNMNIIEQENDGRASRNSFPAGTTIVRFTAFSNDRKQQASCEMEVNVRDVSAPVIQRCPRSMSVISHKQFGNVSWEEPLFSDNVRLSRVQMSRVPSGPITWGTYRVTYTASDAAGNKAECAFSVTVRSSARCNNIQRPHNGRIDCRHWLRGKYCEVSCDRGYEFESRPSHVYVCSGGKWTPSNQVPNCIRQNPSTTSPTSTTLTVQPAPSTVATTQPTRLNSNFSKSAFHSDCGPGSEMVRFDNGTVTCKSCPAGYYRPNLRIVRKCIPCPRGFYQGFSGMSHCDQCPNFASVRRRDQTIRIRRGFASIEACSLLGEI